MMIEESLLAIARSRYWWQDGMESDIDGDWEQPLKFKADFKAKGIMVEVDGTDERNHLRDWRNCIPDDIKPHWSSLSRESKMLLFLAAQEDAIPCAIELMASGRRCRIWKKKTYQRVMK